MDKKESKKITLYEEIDAGLKDYLAKLVNDKPADDKFKLYSQLWEITQKLHSLTHMGTVITNGPTIISELSIDDLKQLYEKLKTTTVVLVNTILAANSMISEKVPEEISKLFQATLPEEGKYIS